MTQPQPSIGSAPYRPALESYIPGQFRAPSNLCYQLHARIQCGIERNTVGGSVSIVLQKYRPVYDVTLGDVKSIRGCRECQVARLTVNGSDGAEIVPPEERISPESDAWREALHPAVRLNERARDSPA